MLLSHLHGFFVAPCDQIPVLLGCRNAPCTFLLKRMQDIEPRSNLDGIDEPIGITFKIVFDFKDATP